jgi:hypothetical protein
VHLADANGAVIAQHDGAPAFGTYPTSAWKPGEAVVDVHDVQVDAPPGEYSLLIGLYDPATLERVPAFDAQGKRLSEDRVPLARITITQ